MKRTLCSIILIIGLLMLSFSLPSRAQIANEGIANTYIGGTLFDVTIYKLDNEYLASRSDEYGYANYKVEW